MPRIVVLGASGFIGSHLVAALERRGRWKVEGHSSATCNLLDLGQIAQVFADDTRDTTIVFAAGINRTQGDSLEKLEANLRMVHNLMTSVRKRRNIGNLIFLSSVDVYGFPPAGVVIDENTPARPIGYYGLGKFAAEKIAQWEFPAPAGVAVLRLPGVFGANDRGLGLLGQLASRIREGQAITLKGNGACKRDLLPVGILENLVCELVDHPRRLLVNVVTGNSRTLLEWATLVASRLGCSPTLNLVNERDERDADLVFDPTYLRESFADVLPSAAPDPVQEYIERRRID